MFHKYLLQVYVLNFHFLKSLNLITPSPTLLCCGRTVLLSQTCLSSSVVGPFLRRPAEAPAHTTSPNQRVLQGFSCGGSSIRPYLMSRPKHT